MIVQERMLSPTLTATHAHSPAAVLCTAQVTGTPQGTRTLCLVVAVVLLCEWVEGAQEELSLSSLVAVVLLCVLVSCLCSRTPGTAVVVSWSVWRAALVGQWE